MCNYFEPYKNVFSEIFLIIVNHILLIYAGKKIIFQANLHVISFLQVTKHGDYCIQWLLTIQIIQLIGSAKICQNFLFSSPAFILVKHAQKIFQICKFFIVLPVLHLYFLSFFYVSMYFNSKIFSLKGIFKKCVLALSALKFTVH